MDHDWTFSDLMGAFLDLTLTFFLLCGAMSAFLSSKFLQIFGQRLPCPCRGRFGPPHSLPQIQKNLINRFPFAPVCSHTEGSCCRLHFLNPQNMGFEEEICDSVSSKKNPDFNTSPLIQKEEALHGSSLSLGKIGSSTGSVKQLIREKPWLTLSENNLKEGYQDSRKIIILERLLEEEKSARIALQLELEKERNAAGTAAEEAMAMILRLHSEKASIEMEARQFERIVEERSAYDDEEMAILKEIIVRRERENHVLEKEVEFYKLITLSKDDRHEPVDPFLDNLGSSPEWIVDDQPQFSEQRSKSIRIPGENDAPEKDSFDPHLYGSDVSLSRTDNSDSVQPKSFPEDDQEGGKDEELERIIELNDVHVIEGVMNKERYSLSPIIQGSNASASKGIIKSDGRKSVDLKRRLSISDSMEARGQMNRKFSGSRRALQSMSMSYDCFSLSTLCKNSKSGGDKERLELGAEVEFLRDRLKIIQSGRKKLSSSLHEEKENSSFATEWRSLT